MPFRSTCGMDREEEGGLTRLFSHAELTTVLDATASGVYVIAVTPFHDDGRLDDASADRKGLG